MTEDRHECGPLLLLAAALVLWALALWLLAALSCPTRVPKKGIVMAEAAVALVPPAVTAATICVCPHCRKATHRHAFLTPDGHWLESHHCTSHGDVIPARKPVTLPDWAAA